MFLRVISFVIVGFLSLKAAAFGQLIHVEKKVHIYPYTFKNYVENKEKELSVSYLSAPASAQTQEQLSALKHRVRVPSNLFVQQLGFVCKQEYKLQKATSIPFRFRLGSLAYTDYMERKPNALKPN